MPLTPVEALVVATVTPVVAEFVFTTDEPTPSELPALPDPASVVTTPNELIFRMLYLSVT